MMFWAAKAAEKVVFAKEVRLFARIGRKKRSK
jgi:hypothetical protein